MIRDWDLWPIIVAAGRPTPLQWELVAIRHDVDDVAAEIGRQLIPTLERLAASLAEVLA